MSLTFPTGIQQKPSSLSGLPNRFSRPSFGTLYGFDAVGGVDGVLLAENGDFLITESGDYLEVETASSTTYTSNDNRLTLTLTGSSAVFNWSLVTSAIAYRARLSTSSSPLVDHSVDYGASATSATIDIATIGANAGQPIQASLYWAFTPGAFNSASLLTSTITF
jgi:hypothetical protein